MFADDMKGWLICCTAELWSREMSRNSKNWISRNVMKFNNEKYKVLHLRQKNPPLLVDHRITES